MALTKTEKITNIQEQIAQLENRRKRLIQEQKIKERKDRTRRLCKRAGLLESLLPDTIPLTDELFKTFLEKTVLLEYAKRILTELTAKNAVTAAPNSTNAAVTPTVHPFTEAAETEQDGDTDGSEDGGIAQG